MRIHCNQCSNDFAYITNQRQRHFCKAKQKWIKQRHYEEGIKKCGYYNQIKLVMESAGIAIID